MDISKLGESGRANINNIRPPSTWYYTKFFYSRPHVQKIPENCYQSFWTYQYLDDNPGLFPDIEVILAIDPFSFILGGAVAALYSHFDGEIYGMWRHRRSNWGEADSWIEDCTCLGRLYNVTNMYIGLNLRYLYRIACGGFTYVLFRGCIHLLFKYTLARASTAQYEVVSPFGLMWTSATIYSIWWGRYYTRQSTAWNVVAGCWIGLGMTFAENIYEILCNLPPSLL